MSISQNDIIEAIKTNPFTQKDYSKNILITIDGIANLFPDKPKDDINKIISKWDGIKILDGLTGQIERLFFYGEKARYFWNEKLNSKEYNFDINETSPAIFEYIFLLFKELMLSPKKDGTKRYMKKNLAISSFFKGKKY